MTGLEQRLGALSPEKRRLAELLIRERRPPTSASSHGGPFGLLTEEDRRRLPEGLEDAYPLAKLQLGMIYHMEMTLDDPVPAYHNVNSFHVRAPFDAEALQRAVDLVVARHATLRTSFHLEGFSEPLQVVHRSVQVEIQVEDLRRFSDPEQDDLLERFFQAENRRVFDLARPPLLRVHVHLRDDQRFQFTLTEPHVISEGWSTTSTLAEIADVYLAITEERPLPEAAASLPYREFVRLEREALGSEEAREFWRQRLEGWSITRLPRWPARYRPAERARNRKPSWELPADLLARLQSLARAAGVPLKSVLLAAHLKVLSLWSGDERVTTGLEFHGRPEAREGDQVRGVFINTLPVRVPLDGLSWSDLALRAFEAETEVLPFRRFPLAALQEGRKAPLFEGSFTYLHFHGVDRVFGYEQMTLYRDGISDLSVSSFPLAVTFHMAEGSARVLALILEYDDEEFPIHQVRAVRRTFERVLRAMADDPSAPHDRALLLGPGDAQQVLVEWNDTVFEAAGEPLIHRRIERWATEAPEAVAVEDGDQALTYGELDRRAGALAVRLRALGVRADVPVGLCAERSCGMVVGMLGVLKAGGSYLPLDPAYPAPRLRFLLQDSGASVVVAEGRYAALAERSGVGTVEEIPAAPACGPAPPTPELDPGHLAYVIYTSGSTGRPKGVLVTHRGLVASTAARPRVYRERVTRYLLLSSYAFDSSVAGIFWTLCDGGTLVLPPQGAERDPEQIARLAATRRPSHLLTVPSLYALLLDEDDGLPLAGLRTAVTAGEACSSELVARHRALLPATRLFNEYGPTEGTVWCSVSDTAGVREGERPPIGRPVPGARLRVLGRGMEPLPVGAPGELWLGGTGLARGYLQQPRLTAERFVPDPRGDGPGARAYRTGDLGRWLPDGEIEFLGREDHQVKLGGFRIELQEIEAAAGALPGVSEVAALVRDDAAVGPRLVLYVAGRREAAPSSAELRALLAERLPEYMVPSHVVVLESMPLNPNGKVDRAALPAPATGRRDSDRRTVPPRDEIERTLAGVWREMLGIEEIGVHDNFFHLGGTSLLLIQTHRRQRTALGADLTLAEFFRNPTIAALAEALRRGRSPDPAAAGTQRAGARKSSARHAARARALRRESRR